MGDIVKSFAKVGILPMALPSSTIVEFQHPCRDRNDSHTLMKCTVSSLYCSACVVIYIFHICTRDHAYLDRLQT